MIKRKFEFSGFSFADSQDKSGKNMKREKQIAQLAQMACIWEACAPKPGSVNRAHDFSDASLEDFLTSAIAIGPSFESAASACVGKTIWRATQDTQRLVHSNTNLGIILLLSPLVKACLTNAEIAVSRASLKVVPESLRQSLRDILNSLSVEDTRLTYAAIRLAEPGGLGRVPQADVSQEPSITLLQAMALAQDRDSIAREYVSGFGITFETGLPALKESLSLARNFSSAVVQTFLVILSRVPDTLIARKRGYDSAIQVSKRAKKVLQAGGIFTPRGREELAVMDRKLRDTNHTLNPGTTSDLTAAAIFLVLIENPELLKNVSGFKFQVPG
jgi:triphosphoribosyl-dephospho-CoA synthase